MKDNKTKQRFELEVEGKLAFADYRIEGKTLYLPHVEADPALRGKGAAGELMKQVMAFAAAEGFDVVPICSYAVAWIKRNS